MKRWFKLCLIMVLVTAMLLATAGCCDCRELNALGIVMGVGVDRGEPYGEIAVTVQVADVGQDGSGSSSSNMQKESSTNSNFFNSTQCGIDILSTLHKFSLSLSRKLYFAHNQVVIFGEDLAKQGVRDIFDFFLRYSESRMNVYVFVAKGKAADVLNVQPTFEKIPSAEIASLMSDPIGSVGKPTVLVKDFASQLISETSSAVAPLIQVEEKDGEKYFSIAGCAVFKSGSLVGELTPEETKGYQWIKGNVKYSNVAVTTNQTLANVIITSKKSKITPVLEDGNVVSFRIKITAQGSLISQEGPMDFTKLENLALLKKNVEFAIQQDIERTIEKTCQMGADIFAFGESIHGKYPKEWEQLQQQWEEYLKTIRVETTVSVAIGGTGKTTTPLYPKDMM